ncbi:MAG: M14 family metallopeptidase [Lachnospiraceae bacterium]|nr:M14 family metallopeptidase [Lachnospiraceae bacterium]
MVEVVTASKMPVGETLEIRKRRISPEKITGKEKIISIVTGTHGDELEGQYVCYELGRRLNQERHLLKGYVDIYPALNPLGIDSITRGFPNFDLDMNRIFPGNKDGSMAEFIADGIVTALKDSALCIDIHASNIYLKEIPQVRINEIVQDELIPYAKKLNIDYIWVHGAATVLESTLAHSLNSIGVPTLVVEMGVGMRITKEYGNQLVEGILNLMKEMGIYEGKTIKVREPLISKEEGDVAFLNASAAGVFLPGTDHWKQVKKGEKIGEIVNPLTGEVLEETKAPCDGMLFTLREYPIVNEGSLLARILRRKPQ